MANLITGLDPDRIRANLAEIRQAVDDAAARAGRDPAEIEILAATKYVRASELGALREAGLTLLGENRAQDLAEKVTAFPNAFSWDFIGRLQSRKVKEIVPYVRLIHSVGSDSALRQLALHAPPELEVLVEVDVAGEEGKAGVAASELPAFLERCPVRVGGLMTMPPATEAAEDSRRWFAALRELAERHHLARLSMGTSQDFAVAVEEGATLVRIGAGLLG